MEKSKANPVELSLLLILMAFFLLVRVNLTGGERVLPDEALYAWLAESIARNPAFLLTPEAWYPHPPLFPLILSWKALSASPVMNFQTICLLINMTGIAGLYLLARRFLSPLAALTVIGIVGTHSFYTIHSSFILIDSLIAIAHIPFMLALLSISAHKDLKRDDAFVSLTALIIALLKGYGAMLVIPIVFFYYIMVLDEIPVWQRVKRAFICLIPSALAFIPYCTHTIIPQLFHGQNRSELFSKPFWSYFLDLNSFIGGGAQLLFLLIGAVYLKDQSRRIKLLLTGTALIEIFVLSTSSCKEERYLLPVLFACALIIGIGIDGIIHRSKKYPYIHKAILIVPVLFIFLLSYDMWKNLPPYIPPIQNVQSGFKEAGGWIHAHNNTPETSILSGSIYQTRYFSKIELKEHGGQIQSIPPELSAFKAFLNTHHERIILEMNHWQYIQPTWIWPVTNEKINTLHQLGFKTKLIVRKPWGGHIIPVVWVLERPAIK